VKVERHPRKSGKPSSGALSMEEEKGGLGMMSKGFEIVTKGSGIKSQQYWGGWGGSKIEALKSAEEPKRKQETVRPRKKARCTSDDRNKERSRWTGKGGSGKRSYHHSRREGGETTVDLKPGKEGEETFQEKKVQNGGESQRRV